MATSSISGQLYVQFCVVTFECCRNDHFFQCFAWFGILHTSRLSVIDCVCLFLVILTNFEPSQLICFRLAFPDGCVSFYGPHAPNCVEELRRIAGLVEEGWSNVRNLSDGQRNALDTLNIA